MRTLVLALLVLAVAIAAWLLVFKKDKKGDDAPKPEPVAVSQYSAAFNSSISGMLTDYNMLTEAFVNWDTASINTYTAKLQASLDSINLEEISKDTVIYQTAPMFLDNAKADAKEMVAARLLDIKKESFSSLSENIYNLLRTIRFDQRTLYWQECPMALENYNASGFWLSDSARIRNPYLGKKDPKYGSSMLKCGETRDSIHFAQEIMREENREKENKGDR